jgi:hypothetical protein
MLGYNKLVIPMTAMEVITGFLGQDAAAVDEEE